MITASPAGTTRAGASALARKGYEMSEELAERLRVAEEAWRAHVLAVERLNAAIPTMNSTRLERDLYAERYQVGQEVEREARGAALKLVMWCADNHIADALASPAAPNPGQSPSPSDVERVADALRDDPFPDDIRLLGTTQHDQRCEHYARAALSAMPNPKGGWMPIETAPRDGSEFLGGYWHQKRWLSNACKIRVRPSGEKVVESRTGWRFYATHWMPHPAAPDHPDDISTGQGEDDNG